MSGYIQMDQVKQNIINNLMMQNPALAAQLMQNPVMLNKYVQQYMMQNAT